MYVVYIITFYSNTGEYYYSNRILHTWISITGFNGNLLLKEKS